MAKKRGGGTAKKAPAGGASRTKNSSKGKVKGGLYTPSKKAWNRAAQNSQNWFNGYPPAATTTPAAPPADPPPADPPPGPDADTITGFMRAITAILQQYGLNTPGMLGYLKQLLIDEKISDDPSEVELMGHLYDQSDFRARFPSIAAQADKQKAGEAVKVWSPREVIEYEETMRNALSSYGIDGYDVKTTTANLILGDVSANEAAMRVSLAAYAATTGPREVADALMQHEGIGPGDLVAFYLNADKATKEIERKHATAQMQAWQKQQGLQQDWGFSEQVVAQGIQNDQAQSAFAQAAMQKNITSGYGETTTESDTKKAALGMSSQSEQSVRRSLSSRQGSFNKSGGAAESQTGVSGLRSSK